MSEILQRLFWSIGEECYRISVKRDLVSFERRTEERFANMKEKMNKNVEESVKQMSGKVKQIKYKMEMLENKTEIIN